MYSYIPPPGGSLQALCCSWTGQSEAARPTSFLYASPFSKQNISEQCCGSE